jgi:hypothetical protein
MKLYIRRVVARVTVVWGGDDSDANKTGGTTKGFTCRTVEFAVVNFRCATTGRIMVNVRL